MTTCDRCGNPLYSGVDAVFSNCMSYAGITSIGVQISSTNPNVVAFKRHANAAYNFCWDCVLDQLTGVSTK